MATQMMRSLRSLGFVLGLGLSLGLSTLVSAQAPAAAQATAATATPAATPATPPATNGPPAGFVAAAEPKADESNAQRSKTQPGNNAPFWRDVRESGNKPGVSSLPGAEQGTLIQSFVQYPGSRLTSAGEAWRQVRNQWIIPYGGALIFIAVLALALFYWRKGALGHDHSASGPVIERFTPFERAAHWTNAITFVVLAISGLVIAFGKFILLPVFGGTLFGWLTYALKTAHNFAGPLFAVSLLVVIITFIKDNFPRASDLTWLKRGGGMFGGEDVPSHRFNAGEKGVFWFGVCAAGLVVVGSGLVLDKLVPGFGDVRSDMQIAHMIHASMAMVMMAILIGHIYMGTIGMRGAFGAMRTGYVSDGWAREHHALWHDDIRAGKIPAKRSNEPAPDLGAVTPQA